MWWKFILPFTLHSSRVRQPLSRDVKLFKRMNCCREFMAVGSVDSLVRDLSGLPDTDFREAKES